MRSDYQETEAEIAQEMRTQHPELPFDRVEDIVRAVMHHGSASLWRLSRGVRAWELSHRLKALQAEDPALFIGAATKAPTKEVRNGRRREES